MLLCDVDHGSVHELDLVLTRRDGRLVALTPDGRRVWGAADAAFAHGLAGPGESPEATAPAAFVGVQPIDELAARRPGAPPVPRPAAGAPGASADPLFPEGAPPLPDAMRAGGERMDMAWAVGVLMGNRDLRRRLAAEARGTPLVAA
ncbi:hypothetical protein [Blastococcus sp. SYSU DS1024]